MPTSWTSLKKVFCFVLILSSVKVFSYDGLMHGEKHIKIAQSKYFDIIYSEGSTQSANVIYTQGDQLMEELCSSYNLVSTFRLPVVISSGCESFNAYFMPAPFNHIVVYDTLVEGDFDIHSENLISTFKHELTHAVTYNHKSKANRKLASFWGDTYNFGELSVPWAFVEGASVTEESLEGEGRMNNGFYTFPIRQSKVDGTFPNYGDIMGSRDIYPSRTASYLFGGMFSTYLQSKYGKDKYASFWYRLINIESLNYFHAFKAVYGLSLKDAWDDFYNQLQVPEISLTDPSIEELNSSIYSHLTSCRTSYAYADTTKNKVYYVKDGHKKSYKVNGVDKISLSSSGRFMAVSYTTNNTYLLKKRIVVYDLEQNKEYHLSSTGVKEGCIIEKDGKVYLAYVSFNSQNSSIVIKDLDLENSSIGKTHYERPNGFGNMSYSLSSDDNGDLFFINKKGALRTINRLNLKGEETSFSYPGSMIINYLSIYGETISFSYVTKDSFPRYGRALIKDSSLDYEMDERDISGGIFNPVQIDDTSIVYCGHFMDGMKLYKGELPNLKSKGTIKASPYEQKIQEMPCPISEVSKNYNPLSNFKGGTLVPFSIAHSYSNEDFKGRINGQGLLDILLLPFGFTYVTSTPWTWPIYGLSGGYNPLTNSGSLLLGAYGSSMEGNLFNTYYLMSQVEFDKYGYKQHSDNLYYTSKIGIGNNYYIGLTESFIYVNGRSSLTKFKKDFKATGLDSYFEALCKPEDIAYKHNIIKNTSSLFLNNYSKCGNGLYDYEGFELRAIVSSFDDHIRAEETLVKDGYYHISLFNIYPKLETKFVLGLPFIISCYLTPSYEDYLYGKAQVILFNKELQKAPLGLSALFFNRLTFSTTYTADWICENTTSYLPIRNIASNGKKLVQGDLEYTDIKSLQLSLELTPNFGVVFSSALKFSLDFILSNKYNYKTDTNSWDLSVMGVSIF